MAEKLRPFRYLGAFGDPGDRKGVLHIDRPDDHERPRRVIRPGDIVKDVLNLEKLGAERIAELVKDGHAEYLDVLEKLGVENLMKKANVTDDSSEKEIELSESAASDAAKVNIGKKALADKQVESGAAQTDSRITGESMGIGGRTPATPPTSIVDDDTLGGPPK